MRGRGDASPGGRAVTFPTPRLFVCLSYLAIGGDTTDGIAGNKGSKLGGSAPPAQCHCPRSSALLLTGSSTVDLLIYQTLCYTHDELREVDVGDFVLKPCGLEEFLQK